MRLARSPTFRSNCQAFHTFNFIRSPVFKTGALNHSATLPSFERSKLFSPFRRTKQNVANALQTSVLRALFYGGTEGAVNSRRTGPPAPGESIAAVREQHRNRGRGRRVDRALTNPIADPDVNLGADFL